MPVPDSALHSKSSSQTVSGTVIQSFPLHREPGGKKVFSCLLEGKPSGEHCTRLGPNRIRVVFENEWADACCFIGPTDRMTLANFDIEINDDLERPFDAIVNNQSTVDIVRHREISLTCENVGNFDFRLDTTKRASTHATRIVQGHNQFVRAGQYYDVVCGTGPTFKRRAQFVADILSQRVRRRILDVGCGSGLYTFCLRYLGFDVTGVDASPVQLEVARSKLEFHRKTEPTPQLGPLLLQADISKFALRKDSPGSAEGTLAEPEKQEQFDCALLMGCLQMLPDYERIRRTLRRVWYHLELGAIALCDIPNSMIVGKEDYTQSNTRYPIDSGSRSLGAAILDEGTLDVVERSYNKGEYRVTEWHGYAVQTKKELRCRYYTTFDECYEELLINAPLFEDILDKEGFDVLALYGDADGSDYDSRASTRRFYILKRRDMPPAPPVDDDDDEASMSPSSSPAERRA
eukprot:TRINITY_DN60162_c0_g1_i1.p1 TRINITY_DN60162_c0_g1~~TRINITY_DN60162_c0_g1_i1.p1  ORF type:complete len:489 (+),score=138.44 TRINITY_DN60162_c0_g1_i1:82-1467(+)